MSVHTRSLPDVSVHARKTGGYEVRWTEGTRQRSRTFRRRRDAERFDARVKEAKEQGRVGMLTAGRMTLAQYVEEQWWPHAERYLETNTRTGYEITWDLHVAPYLGEHRLAQITPPVVDRYKHALADAGVGAPTARKALAVLSSALSQAVVWGLIAANPARAVRPPQLQPAHRRPVPAHQVEAMRTHLLQQRRAADAILIVLLAYAGLRPEEALALDWHDIGQRTIHVWRAVAFGEHKATKTRNDGTVDLLAPLAEDLDAYRDLTGGQGLVIPRARDGELWADHDYRNWRKRLYRPTAAAADVEDQRPYTLRSSFASLLIAGNQPITYVAAQCRHSVETCARTYARLFAEYAGQRIDPVTTIRESRGADLRKFFANDADADRDTP